MGVGGEDDGVDEVGHRHQRNGLCFAEVLCIAGLREEGWRVGDSGYEDGEAEDI